MPLGSRLKGFFVQDWTRTMDRDRARTPVALWIAVPSVLAVLYVSFVRVSNDPRWLVVEGVSDSSHYRCVCPALEETTTEDRQHASRELVECPARVPDAPPRFLLPIDASTCKAIEAAAAADIQGAVSRTSQLENLLVALAGFLLGISGYFGMLIFGSDAPPSKKMTVPYRIAMVQMFCTTAAYMHVFKILLGTMAYLIRLEYLTRPDGLRFFGSTMGALSHPNLPRWFSWMTMGADATLGVVVIFPLSIVAGAILFLGRFGWSRDAVSLVLIAFFALVVLYIGPAAIETVVLLNLANPQWVPITP